MIQTHTFKNNSFHPRMGTVNHLPIFLKDKNGKVKNDIF